MSYLSKVAKTCSLLTVKTSVDIDVNDSERFWIVRSGCVDIFFVQKDHGEEDIPRKHIFRARNGDVIFGLPVTLNKNGALIAVGTPGTKVLKCEISDAIELAKNEKHLNILTLMLDRWFAKLLSGMKFPSAAVSDYTEITYDKEISLPEKSLIRASKKQLVWVCPQDGNLMINSRDDYSAIRKNAFFPLTASIYAMAKEECKIQTYSTQQLINKYLFKNALQGFYVLLVDYFLQDFKQQTKEDLERLKQKKVKNRLDFLRALSHLKNILMYRRKENLFVADKTDPLYAACSIIARKQDINIVDKQTYKKNAAMDSVEDFARLSNFPIRRVKLTQGWSKKDNGLLVGFTKDKRTVALLQLSSSQYEMYDPMTGIAQVVSKDIEKTLEDYAYMFYLPFEGQSISSLDLLKFGFKGRAKDFLLIGLIGAGGGLLSLLTPLMTQVIFDSVIPGGASWRLVQIAVLLVAAIVSIGVFDFVRNIGLLRFDGKFGSASQAAIWNRILNLPVNFFRKFTAGDLAIRSMGIDTIRQQLSGSYVQVIMGVIFSSFNFLLLFYYDWRMALLAVGISIVFLMVLLCANFILYRYNKVIQTIHGDLSGMLYQFIAGIVKLRISNTEERAFTLWANLFAKQQKIVLKAKTINNFLDAMYGIFPILALLAIFMWFASHGLTTLTTGQFLAFNAAFINFQMAMIQIGLILPVMARILPLYKRSMPLLQALPELTSERHLPGKLSGKIKVDRVNFRYNEDSPLVIKDVSLRVESEEFVAIVGESGSGKSTLFRLLLGFEQPEAGSVYYDNLNLDTLNLQEVRRQIGVVLQNSKLMAGTVYDNISGTSNITQEEAYEIAELSGLKEDIEQMPMKMHTYIGVDGSSLSGGQRQRLIIARALAKKPKILLFDEATSALDNKTQAIVSKTLEDLNVTRIVIAHRLSTIINADRIYVLRDGAIIQEGTYKQLMQQEGFFKVLAERQLA